MAEVYNDKLVVVHNGVIKKIGTGDTVQLDKITLDTELNLSGSATMVTGSIGELSVTGNAFITGDLTVNGTTTTINSTEVTVVDKAIVVATGSTDGQIAAAGGAGLKVADETNTLATFLYDGVDSWDVSDHLNLAASQEFKINDDSVLSKTTLGNSVVNSSLTSVGTLTGLTVNGNVTVSDGTNNLNIASHDGTNGLQLAGALVTSTAAELNLLDATAGSSVNLADGDAIIIGDASDSNATKKVLMSDIKNYIGSGGSVAADNISEGDAAVSLTTTAGNDITIGGGNFDQAIMLDAPNGVGQEYTGIVAPSGAYSTILSGSVVVISNTEGTEGYLELGDRSVHSYALGVVSKDVSALTAGQLNPTASVMVHSLPGVQVPVLFETSPSASTDQGKFCYLATAGDYGKATLTVPGSGNIIRLGVLASTASDGGLYKVLWQPQFIASL